MGQKRGWSWWKWGCVGCMGAVALLFLMAVIVVGLVRREASRIEPQSQVVTPELPPVESPPGPPPDRPGDSELVPAIPAGSAGRVVLSLSGGQFHLEPAAPGESLHVEARYDRRSYGLEESVESDPGSPWTYRVSFHKTGGSFLTTLAELFGGARPHVTVYLPRDVPLEIEADVGQGGLEVQLGGLWLTRADIEFAQGGFLVDVDEPMRAAMEHLRIRGAMGGVVAEKLGNASPRVLDVGVRMGGLQLDLRGAWQNDAEVTVETEMGGGALRLPRDVRVEGIDSLRRDPPPDPEVPRPTLRFTSRTTIKDLKLQ